MNHKDLQVGDILAADNMGRMACFRVLKISRSWFRRRRPYLILCSIYTGYKAFTMDLSQDIMGKKMWCSPEEIDGTIRMKRAFVQRDGKILDAPEDK